MAWPAIKTWSVAEFVTAALLNAQMRDAFNWIGGADGRGTTLPASPVDGQLFVFVADATNGVEWLLKYNAGDASSFKWHAIGGVPLRANGTSTAISGTLAGITGAALTAALGGDYDVHFDARLSALATANGAYCGPKIGAAAFNDEDAVALPLPGGTTVSTFFRSGRTQRFASVTAASLIQLQARTDIAGTGTVASANLSIMPARVG